MKKKKKNLKSNVRTDLNKIATVFAVATITLTTIIPGQSITIQRII